MADRMPDGVLAALREMSRDSLGRAAADEIDRLRALLDALQTSACAECPTLRATLADHDA